MMTGTWTKECDVCVWIWYNNSSLKPKWMHNIKGKLCWTSLQSYNINPIQYVNSDALLFVGWMNTFIQLLHQFFLPSFVFLQSKRTSLSKQSLLRVDHTYHLVQLHEAVPQWCMKQTRSHLQVAAEARAAWSKLRWCMKHLLLHLAPLARSHQRNQLHEAAPNQPKK